MREGGQSSASIKNRLYSQAECWNAWVKNDISYFPVWTILKPFSKINQWFLKTA